MVKRERKNVKNENNTVSAKTISLENTSTSFSDSMTVYWKNAIIMQY